MQDSNREIDSPEELEGTTGTYDSDKTPEKTDKNLHIRNVLGGGAGLTELSQEKF